MKDNQLTQSVQLTERENEVIALLLRGKSNASIAADMELSINTVKSHLKHIYKKQGVSSRTELILQYLNPPVQ